MNKNIWITISVAAGIGGYFLVKKILEELEKSNSPELGSELCSCHLEKEYEKAKEDLDAALEDFEKRIKDHKEENLVSEDEFLGSDRPIFTDSIYSDDRDYEIPEDFVPAINETWKEKKEKLLYFAIIGNDYNDWSKVKIFDFTDEVEDYLTHNNKVEHWRLVDINDREDVLSFMEFASTSGITGKHFLKFYDIWNITENDWKCYDKIIYDGKKRSKMVKKYFKN